MDDELNTGEQAENSKTEHLKPWQYKAGQSGNPSGRPKGISMKEYVRNKFAGMTENEREEFLNGIAKDIVWKQAEGNPESTTDITSNGEGLAPILVKFIDASNNGKNNRDTSGVQKPV